MKSYGVYAQANAGSHNFNLILCGIENDIRRCLEASYEAETNRKLYDDLSRVGGVLARSRYPYEPENDPTSIDNHTLKALSPFLKSFVDNMESRETIRWENNAAT